MQAVQDVAPDGCPGFHPDREKLAAFLDDEVDFMAGPVPPEIDRRLTPMVPIRFDNLGDDKVFIQLANTRFIRKSVNIEITKPGSIS